MACWAGRALETIDDLRARRERTANRLPDHSRWLAVEAAWQVARRSQRVRSFFERIHQDQRERRRIALVATAHYLLRVMLAMLETGEVWRQEAA